MAKISHKERSVHTSRVAQAADEGFRLLGLFQQVRERAGVDAASGRFKSTTTNSVTESIVRSKPVPIVTEGLDGAILGSLVLVEKLKTIEDRWNDPLTPGAGGVIIGGTYDTQMGLEYTLGPVTNVGGDDLVPLLHPKLTVITKSNAVLERYMTPRNLKPDALADLCLLQAVFAVHLGAAAVALGIG